MTNALQANKTKVPPSLLRFMQINAAHADLAIAELSQPPGSSTPMISTADQGRLLRELSPIYRRFAAALNTHVYVRNAREVPPPFEEYELLCYCMVSADTLADGIKLAMKFVSALNGRGGTLALAVSGEKAVLSCEVGWTCRSISALSLDMLSLTFYSKFFAWLIAEPLSGLELSFSHQALLDPVYLYDLLHCRSRYDTTQTTISFDKHLLSRPIVKTQRQLTNLLACGPLEFLQDTQPVCVTTQVKNILHKALLEQLPLPPLDHVAYQLGKSGSTLRRRLAVDGASFQSLLDECRKTQAIELLASSQLSVDEIACRIGFSERSAFSHAFKSWTNQTPAAYRETVKSSTNTLRSVDHK